MYQVDALLGSALRSHANPPEMVPMDWVAEIPGHRLAPLVFATLATRQQLDRWPATVQEALRATAVAQALISELLDREVRRLIEELHRHRIPLVLIKGAALAYTHYPDPALRPRVDTDLVVRPADFGAAVAVIRDVGYEPREGVDGTLVTQQAQWHRTVGPDLVHTLDVHRHPFNPHAFAGVLKADELLQAAVPVERLGPGARAPYPVHALLLACAHRAAHHAGCGDLLWAYDIHLIAGSLAAADATRFVALARERGVTAVCASGLDWARRSFETRLPDVLDALTQEPPDRDEPTAEFLRPGRRQVDVLTSDLRALPGWRQRLRLIGQHLFPAPAYMERRYGVRGWLRLAPLYVSRIVRGVPRWFKQLK